LLEEAGERFAIVIIGGAALQLLGVIIRNTRDVDVIAFAEPPTTRARLARPAAHLPAPLQRAILAVAKDRNLPENWLNAGPAGSGTCLRRCHQDSRVELRGDLLLRWMWASLTDSISSALSSKPRRTN
jgi:hypothetical protein